MKEWKKPFMKCVLLEESDMIATSGEVTIGGNNVTKGDPNPIGWDFSNDGQNDGQ